MRDDLYRSIVLGQFESALDMAAHAISRCPAKHWEGIIGKYPFWQVAYHALCFVDLYASPSDDAWKPHPTFHPKGRAELSDEYPSRIFTKAELLAYVEFCNERVKASLSAETPASLRRPSGFSWVKINRAELPIYSLRHLQHHVGQLTAYLRRVNIGTRWGFTGRVLVPVTAPPAARRRPGGSRR